jgi:Uma2 family endonuclease
MSVSKLTNMTSEEYLAAEAISHVRHEYVGGQAFAMKGASAAHNLICQNLGFALRQHLRGSGGQIFIIEMKVRNEADNSFYYPDVLVTCESGSGTEIFKTAPVLIAEILSPSTKQIDLREKLLSYRKIGSLREYVVVHQTRPLVEIFRKDSAGNWEIVRLRNADELVLESMPSGPVRLPVATIYEDITFTPMVGELEFEYMLDDPSTTDG